MNNYLQAMGITSWRLKNRQQELYWLLVDTLDENLLETELVTSVLKLIGVAPQECAISDKMPPANQIVVWNMSQYICETAWLVSPSFSKLTHNPQEKKALWQQIWQHQEQE